MSRSHSSSSAGSPGRRTAVAVLLLTLLGVAACGDDPAPRSQERPREAASPKRPLRSTPRLTLAVEPREARPGSPETGLVVTLVGTLDVGVDGRPGWDLFVCGLRAHYDSQGRFSVRRSFLRAGTYIVLAEVRPRPTWLGIRPVTDGSGAWVTECRITVSTTPEETAHIRKLSAEVVDANGKVDDGALDELVQTHDLRAVPALWKVIEANPNSTSLARKRAVLAIGTLAHLDSVPRLIGLLTDWGVYREVYWHVERLGLWGLEGGWKPAPPEENEVQTVIQSLLLTWDDREPALRAALYQ